jgi:hypothetical protein
MWWIVVAAKRQEKAGMQAKAREWLASLPEVVAVVPDFIKTTPAFQEQLAILRKQGEDFLAAVNANDEFHIPPFSLPEPATEIKKIAKEIFEAKTGFAIEPTETQAEEFKQFFTKEVEEGIDEMMPKDPPPEDDRKPGVYFMTPAYEAPANGNGNNKNGTSPQPVVESTIEGDTRDPLMRMGFGILTGDKRLLANLKGQGWFTDHLGELYTANNLGEEAQPTEDEIAKELKELQKKAIIEEQIKDSLANQMTSLSNDIQKIMRNDAMFKAANGVAMSIAGIIVGCMAVPVVGWIVAAALAVVTAMMTMIDKHYQREVMALSSGVQNRMKMYQILTDTKIKNDTIKIYESTFDKAFADVKAELNAEYKRLGLDKPLTPATQQTAAAIEGLGEEAQQEAQRQGINPAVALFLYFGMNPGAQAAFTQGWQQMVTAFNYNWEQFAKANAAAQRQMTQQITKGIEGTMKAWNRAWQRMTGQEPESTSDKLKGKLKSVWNKFRPYAPLAAGMPPEAWSHYSGQMMVKQVSAKLAQLEAVGKQQLDLSYLSQKKQLDNPEYRKNLYLQIKQSILQSPQVTTIIQNMHKAAQGREAYYKRVEEIKRLKAKAAAEQATTAPPPSKQTVVEQTAPVTPTAAATPTVQPPKKKSKAPLVIGAGAAALAAYLFMR